MFYIKLNNFSNRNPFIAVTVLKKLSTSNYPSFYNIAVDLYNTCSCEIQFTNAPMKTKMRGGRFLLRKLVVLVYIIFLVTSLIIYGVSKHPAGKILFGIAFIISILYFILPIYNLIIYLKNGNIIAYNFIEDSDFVNKDSSYKVFTIDRRCQEELSQFQDHAQLIQYLINYYRINDSSFKLVFFCENFYQYTGGCGIIIFHFLFATILLSSCVITFLAKEGLLFK